MNKKFMKRAIRLAMNNSADGKGGPFGAVVVRGGVVAGEGSNKVVESKDPSAHAEIVAIRAACRKLGTHVLSGCEIYCSCEPCPMCLAAIYWARIDAVYFACSSGDAAAAGFDDSAIREQVQLLQPFRNSGRHGGRPSRRSKSRVINNGGTASTPSAAVLRETPARIRSLPMRRLCREEGLDVLRKWIANPDKHPY